MIQHCASDKFFANLWVCPYSVFGVFASPYDSVSLITSTTRLLQSCKLVCFVLSWKHMVCSYLKIFVWNQWIFEFCHFYPIFVIFWWVFMTAGRNDILVNQASVLIIVSFSTNGFLAFLLRIWNREVRFLYVCPLLSLWFSCHIIQKMGLTNGLEKMFNRRYLNFSMSYLCF